MSVVSYWFALRGFDNDNSISDSEGCPDSCLTVGGRFLLFCLRSTFALFAIIRSDDRPGLRRELGKSLQDTADFLLAWAG